MKNILRALLIALAFIPGFALLAVPATLPQHPPAINEPVTPSQPALSAEDLKMLEEVEQQINSYVSSLPPQEQEKFWKDVDDLTKVMSEMKEDELVKFMEDIFTQEAQAAQQAPAPVPAPVYAAPVEKIEPVVVQSAPVDKEQAAIRLIDDTMTRIANFLRKAQTMLELPGKVISWQKEGKLKNWPASLTWDAFKGHIDELNQKLAKLKDRDPRTNKYKYIADFIKDDALYNNLSKVRDTLNKNEPKIEISSFAIDKMSSESRQAIRNVLMGLQEAYALMAIPVALDKIFEKYEPTAKKLKEAEESAQKQATEMSRRQPMTPGTYVGGTPESRRQTGPSPYDFKDYSLPSRSYDFPEKKQDKLEEPKKAESEGPKEDKKGDDKGKKDGEKSKREESKEAKSVVDRFENAIIKAIETIEDTKNIAQLESHFKSNKDADKEVVEGINAIASSVREAERSVRSMKRVSGKLTDAQKKDYIGDIKKIYKEYSKSLDNLSSQINSIESRLGIYKELAGGQNGKNKEWAYFGGRNEASFGADAKVRQDAITALKEKVGAPANLPDLRKNIQELAKTINEIK